MLRKVIVHESLGLRGLLFVEGRFWISLLCEALNVDGQI